VWLSITGTGNGSGAGGKCLSDRPAEAEASVPEAR
jgi:hypothetical protein